MAQNRRGPNPNGRSLDIRLQNYKQIHAGTAERLGLSMELKACRTLTQARKLLFGIKKGMTR